MTLHLQARPFLNEGRIESLVDPRIGGDYDGEEARRLAFVASLCIRSSAKWRPSMTEVTNMIGHTLYLDQKATNACPFLK